MMTRISIHAPLTGSDYRRPCGYAGDRDFNPRSPYGERPAVLIRDYNIKISIHAPLTGSDLSGTANQIKKVISIHAPLTGSDRHGLRRKAAILISIHAPLTGSDVRRDMLDA